MKKTKNENNKSIGQLNLEIIQLMEQGDHVIKPVWSSWQFGNSYQYNDWRTPYNGMGDKASKFNRNLTRSKDIFGRTVSPLSSKYSLVSSKMKENSYGNVELQDIEEPIVEWEISPNVNPRRIARIEPLVLASRPGINFQTPELPTFEVPDGDVEVVPPPVIPDMGIVSSRYLIETNNQDYSNIRNEKGIPNVLVGTNAGDTGPISQTHIRGTNGKGKMELVHNNGNKFTLKTNNTTFTGIEGSSHSTVFNYSNNLNKDFKYEDYGEVGVRMGGGHDFIIENMDIISSGEAPIEFLHSNGRKYRNLPPSDIQSERPS